MSIFHDSPPIFRSDWMSVKKHNVCGFVRIRSQNSSDEFLKILQIILLCFQRTNLPKEIVLVILKYLPNCLECFFINRPTVFIYHFKERTNFEQETNTNKGKVSRVSKPKRVHRHGVQLIVKRKDYNTNRVLFVQQPQKHNHICTKKHKPGPFMPKGFRKQSRKQGQK